MKRLSAWMPPWGGLVIGAAAGAIISLLIILLAGCGSQSPSLQANLSKAVHGQEVYASVLVIGDEIATSWGNNTSQPLWNFAGSQIGSQETSGSVASRLPALLQAKHYDVVVIMAGQFDLADPAWDYPSACGYDSITPPEATCDNIVSMITQVHQAGGKAILCLGPSIQPGSRGSQIIDDPERIIPLNAEEYFFYRGWTIGYDPPPVAINEADSIIEMWDVMGQSDTGEGGDPVAGSINWTDDGVTMNVTGAHLATSATTNAISQIKGTWGAK